MTHAGESGDTLLVGVWICTTFWKDSLTLDSKYVCAYFKITETKTVWHYWKDGQKNRIELGNRLIHLSQ